MSTDSTENGKHIRNAHFALITTSLVLAVAASLAPDVLVSEAHDELHVLNGIRGQLYFEPSDEALLSASQLANSYWDQIRDKRICVDAQGYLFFLDPLPGQSQRFWGHTWLTHRDKTRGASFGSDNETTLEQVISTWNRLYAMPIEVMHDLNLGDSFPTTKGIEIDIRITDRGVECGIEFSRIARRNDDLELRIKEPADGKYLPIEELTVLIPAQFTKTELNLLPLFLNFIDSQIAVTLSNSSFDRAFPSLSTLSDGLESLKLDALDRYLQKLKETKGPQISIFGAGIPRKSLSNWGLGLLIAVQLYFLIQLRSLCSRISSDFPWIALYGDPLARTVFLLSISVVPLGAASMLTVDTVPSVSLEAALVFVLYAVSVLVAITTLIAGVKIQSQ